MANFYLSVLLASLCVLAHCHHVPGHHGGHDGHEHPTDQPPSKSHQESSHLSSHKIAPSNADFAFNFHRQLASRNTNKNVFFSPASISTALMLLSLGANGTTLDQILSGLGFNQSVISLKEIHDGFCHLLQLLNRPESDVKLSIGNDLFLSDKLQVQEHILKKAVDQLHSNIVPTPFDKPEEALTQINNHIAEKTHGKLVDALKALDPRAVIVLVNTIFMKGFWEKPFDPEMTRKRDFFVNNETTVQVDMMCRHGHYHIYHDEELACEVVKVPYRGSVSALFILPEKGKLNQVEQALGREALLRWETSSHLRRIRLSLPKVSLTTSYDIIEPLEELGIKDVFTDQADLSGFTGMPELKVSKALHKGYLNIHENGTEAAAATIMEIVPMSLPPACIFDRPYIVLIVDHFTRAILFFGRVVNPNEH